MGYPIYHSAYTAAQIEALIANPPRINSSTKVWEVWDVGTSAYVSTGVVAESAEYASQAAASATTASDAKTAAQSAQTAAETAQGKAETAQGLAESAASAAAASAASVTASLADAFSASRAYSAGEYVIHNDALYFFTAAHPAGVWTGTDVVQVTAGEELEKKANIDGAYENMTVGNAEQLVSTVMVEDQVPYIFRTTGGSADVGNRSYPTLVGGTVAWNQLQQNNATGGTDAGITATNNGDGSWSVSGTSSAATWFYCNNSSAYIKIQTGHKYLLRGFPSNSGVFYWKVRNADSSGTSSYADNGAGYILNADASFNATIGIGVYADKAITGTATVYPLVFDLTLLFGSTIADYIYSLETATRGAGVAWMTALFPKLNGGYYPYNAGELLSVNASAHKTVGFNQWDEQWEVGGYTSYAPSGTKDQTTDRIRNKYPIPVLPNTSYYFRADGDSVPIQICYYDKNGTYISQTTGTNYFNAVYTTPANCYYLNFNTNNVYGAVYNHDICINLSWSGYRNGEYEPYVQHTYPLDSSLTLRGVPKLDMDNNLYYDGDTYEADGTVTRRYEIANLSSLKLTYNSGWGCWVSGTGIPTAKASSNATPISGLADKFTIVRASGYTSNSSVGTLTINTSKTLFINNGSSTIAPTGYLVYELETPTTESADPFQSPQIVDDFGTEQYVVTAQSGVEVPVGHVTQYPSNLRDKLQHLPDLASADGLYGVQQTGSNMALVPLPAAVSDLPDPPTTDGTYTLTCTVSDGVATYSWE